MKTIDVGEFEVPFTIQDILNGLIQSLDEKLGEYADSRPLAGREDLREEFRRLTALYLWDLLRQIKKLKDAKLLLGEALEEWLDLACEEVLRGALLEKKDRRGVKDFSSSQEIN